MSEQHVTCSISHTLFGCNRRRRFFNTTSPLSWGAAGGGGNVGVLRKRWRMLSLESQNVMIISCTVTMAHARSRRGVAIGKIWFTLLKVGAEGGGGRWRERAAPGFGCALVVRVCEKCTFVSASAVALAVEALLLVPMVMQVTSMLHKLCSVGQVLCVELVRCCCCCCCLLQSPHRASMPRLSLRVTHHASCRCFCNRFLCESGAGGRVVD